MVVVCVISLFVYSEAQAFQAQWPKYQERIIALIGRTGTESARPCRRSSGSLPRTSSPSSSSAAWHFAELIIMAFFYLLFLLLGSRKLAHRVTRAFPGETRRSAS